MAASNKNIVKRILLLEMSDDPLEQLSVNTIAMYNMELQNDKNTRIPVYKWKRNLPTPFWFAKNSELKFGVGRNF